MRITLFKLEAFDQKNATSLVRELEMHVEGIVNDINPAYNVQFWRDVQIYGLKEAKAYLVRFVSESGGLVDEKRAADVYRKIDEVIALFSE